MLETKRFFTVVLLSTLLLKLLIAYTLPFTTDEAYFYIWGLAPDYGFYDHPPMVGWIYWIMQQVSHAPGWLRLPSVLLTTFIGWGIYRLVARKNEQMGLLAGILYMIMPVNLYGILISTDTSLVFWMFLSVAAFYIAVEKDSRGWFAIAGIFLGMAVLSKYFSALLGFAYLIYFLIFSRNKKGLTNLFIVYLFTLPAVLLNLAWNYDNCWSNYMFNFVNRHDRSSGFSLYTFFGYILMWVYLLVPPVIYYAYKQRKKILALRATPERVFLIAFFIPIVLFQLLSLFKVIGLHWVLGFYPFIFILMGLVLDKQQLRNSIKVVMVISVLHIAAIMTVISTPLSFVKPGDDYYHEVVIGTQPEKFLQAIAPHRNDFHLATVSYSSAAMMTFYAGENVSVIGLGSSHARHDDIMTDYRQMDKKNILVFFESKEALEPLVSLFDTVEFNQVKIEDAEFHILLGKGFNYEKYRQDYLSIIKNRYYQIPRVLPKGECYFYQRYFPAENY